ncbi:hypothetical protein [Agathobacter ruminis]|uniref:hypothetical protein n=1 Tax=Agathobacter ruminis TaxID=1712665 RepID=UPI00234D9D3B|nr:hypothetical protein [Agathobacter ruminis]
MQAKEKNAYEEPEITSLRMHRSLKCAYENHRKSSLRMQAKEKNAYEEPGINSPRMQRSLG